MILNLLYSFSVSHGFSVFHVDMASSLMLYRHENSRNYGEKPRNQTPKFRISSHALSFAELRFSTYPGVGFKGNIAKGNSSCL